jgi:pyridoxamine 5'-phosphate oxidase
MGSLQSLADIRKEYKLKELTESAIAGDPFAQFDFWWKEAMTSGIEEVNAMTLATISSEGLPDARIVLLKGYGPDGFVFFTNYDSRKGKDLNAHPQACLVFFWKELERQVRIKGLVEKVDSSESDTYYHSRPRGSQIGAWASPQSQVIDDRHILEVNEEAYRERFSEGTIPRPSYWGGYRVSPYSVEFWQGRPNRLHDRICYLLQKGQSVPSWSIHRLAP